jgi:branched-chain amino acid transport system substrate-binding protein
MKRTLFVALALCLIGEFGLVPAPAFSANLAGKEVVVGWLEPFTGMGSAYGAEDSVTMNMAVQEINSKGGVGGLPLKIVQYDTAWKGEQAIALLRKLAQTDKVLAVIGPYSSGECQVTFPVANMLKIPIITQAGAAPGLGENNRPWAFRNVMTLNKTIEPAFAKWVQIYKIKTIAKIYESTDFLNTTEATLILPPLLKKYDVREVSTQTFAKRDINFAAQVTAMKAANPDGIWLSAIYEEGANIAREIRRQRMTQPIIAGVGVTGSSYTRLGGEATEGTVEPSNFWSGNPDPMVQEFVKKWSTAFKGQMPPHYTVNLYEIVYMLKHVIETSGVTNDPKNLDMDRERIRNGLAEIKDFPGMGERITIGPDGDAIKNSYILQVKNGNWVRID